MQRVVRDVRRQRSRRGLAQDVVAHRVGVCPSYLCDVERGRRPLSRRVAEALEEALGVKPGRFTRGVQFPRRGRRRLEPITRQALREIGAAIDLELKAAAPVIQDTPRHRFPEQYHGVENVLWPIGAHLGADAQQEVEQLEALKPGDEPFWRHVNGLHFNSWTEKRTLVRVALVGGEFATVSPCLTGCSLPMVCGRTGKDVRRTPQPCLILKDGDMAVALFVQQTVRTSITHRRPDFLLVAALNGRRITAILETGADQWHADRQKDLARTQELGVPVLRARPDHVAHPRFTPALLNWLRSRLTRLAP